jgi:hypothetical protein
MFYELFGINEFHPQSNKTDISQALKFCQHTKKEKALFVISDFMSDGYDQTLKIAAKKNMISLE